MCRAGRTRAAQERFRRCELTVEAFTGTPSASFVVKEVVSRYLNSRRRAIRRLAGVSLSEAEARAAWPRILDHKWYVSERLGRDVGLHVARSITSRTSSRRARRCRTAAKGAGFLRGCR